MIYILKFGLGGGFGGARNFEVVDVADEKEADEIAYECACEEYNNYAGLYGIRTVDEIMEEEELDEDEAYEQYNEEREDWVEHEVKVCDKKCDVCDAYEECSFPKVIS